MEAKLAIKLIRSVREVEKQLASMVNTSTLALQKRLTAMSSVLQEAEYAVGLKVLGTGYFGAAWRRGQGTKAIQYIGVATKFTKFSEQARIFPTREEAESALTSATALWQTRHLWEMKALTEEEVKGLRVMTEIAQ